jgi:ABC-2 type transport system ATP-binding protein
MPPIIHVQGLTKTFWVRRHRGGALGALRGLFDRRRDAVHAVDGLDFSVQRGELVGYLGPNGAGKSTTIKMLTGILVPTSGSLEVAGQLPWRDRTRYVRNIGVVFGQRSTLWWDLPVIESFEILRHVYSIPADRYRQNLATFDGVLGLGAFLRTPVRQLSLGQRMRADLAAALLHDPAILFLDEPTIGLDVAARERIRAFIQEINRERGVTVLLTTHDMGDVEKLCRRVLLIAGGRLLFDGDLEGLRHRFGGERELVVDLAEDEPAGHSPDAGDPPARAGLPFDTGDPSSPPQSPLQGPALPGATLVAREGSRLTYRFRRDVTSASALIARLAERHRIQDLTVREPEIEAAVRRFYEGDPAAEG